MMGLAEEQPYGHPQEASQHVGELWVEQADIVPWLAIGRMLVDVQALGLECLVELVSRWL